MKGYLTALLILVSGAAIAQKTGGKSPLSAYSKEWDNPKYSICNTAATASFMSDTEKQVIYIINLVRAYPQLFCKTIIPRMKKLYAFTDTASESHKRMVKMLREGKPLPLLYPDSVCYAHAHCNAIAVGAKGLVTTDDQPECRQRRYGSSGMSEGFGERSALGIVLSLLGYTAPFMGQYTKIAVAMAPHTVYSTITIVEVGNAGSENTRPSANWKTPAYDANKCPLEVFSPVWAGPKYKACNTAAHASYLSDDEKQIIYILNLARMDPQLFCSTVVKKAYIVSGSVDTSSKQYYKSLVDDLMAMAPLGLLAPDSACYVSAHCHAQTSGVTGYVGHERKNGECTKNYSGECCQYGIKDPLAIVLSLLVDQGVESLGHREICLGGYVKMSPAIAPHHGYGVVAVLDFW